AAQSRRFIRRPTMIRDQERRIQRQRLHELEERMPAFQSGPSHGMPAFVARTATDGSYPEHPACVFRVDISFINPPEKEGGPITFGDRPIKAYASNLGSRIPPLGTPVDVTTVAGGRLVFTYDGDESTS